MAEGYETVQDIYKELVDEPEQTVSMPRPFSEPAFQNLAYPDDTPSAIAKPGGFRRQYLLSNVEGEEAVPEVWVRPATFEVHTHWGAVVKWVEDDLERTINWFSGTRAMDRLSVEVEEVPGASYWKTVATFFKAMVGPAILFLPKAFANGGWLFASLLMIGSAILSCYAMLLLVDCRQRVNGSYGEIGHRALGRVGKWFVDLALFLSQTGFACADIIFVAKNMKRVVDSMSNCNFVAPESVYILLQIPILLPMSWVRYIKIFAVTNIIADAFILFGLGCIYVICAEKVASEGIQPSVELINADKWPIFIGTAVYAFEGIGLVIPIHESMEDKSQFPKLLVTCMMTVCFLLVTFADLSYFAYGDKLASAVTLNLDDGNGLTYTIQILYSLAVIFSIPLMLFPAIRILEDLVFRSEYAALNNNASEALKWKENALRAFLVLLSCGISIGGSDEFDEFVSIIGSVCCIPLAFIFPAMFHLQLVGTKKIIPRIIVGFGIIAMCFTFYMDLKAWIDGGGTTEKEMCDK